MGSRRSACVLVAGMATGSCSLVFGIQGADYVGAADAGLSPLPDVGARGTDSAPPDVGGATATDGGACGLPICDDFERDAVGHDDWTVETAGGTVEIDQARFDKTPHRSLHASVGAGSGDARSASAFLSSPFVAGHHVHCSFSLLINDTGGSQSVDLFLVEATGNGAAYPSSIRFGLSQTVFQVRQDVMETDGGCACPSQSFYFGDVTTPPAPKTAWRAVTIDTDLQSATVTVDDYTHTYSFGPLSLTHVRLRLGILDFVSTAGDVDIDDLACEVD